MTQIPLDPGVGGQCITQEKLETADIIVSTTNASVSGLIRAGTRSVVSHAILYIGDGAVIEAIGEGVVRRQLSEAISDARLAVAYRHMLMNPSRAGIVVAHASSFLGRAYDTGGAAGAGLADQPLLGCFAVGGLILTGACSAARRGSFDNADAFFCSELVFEAFRLAGVPIGDRRSDTALPKHIPEAYGRRQLQYVGHLR